MKKYKISIIALLFIIALMAVFYLTMRGYPRIVRSAYYRNPYYGFKAVLAEYLTIKKFSAAEALARIKEVGLTPTGTPKFLCLLHEPKEEIDKPIIARYFGLLSKCAIKTDSALFWEIQVQKGIAFVEADTGRIIYLEFDESGGDTLKYY